MTPPPTCIVSQKNCYDPICFYDDETNLRLWGFFQWKNSTTIKKIVFCQLQGDKQVGKVDYKDGILHIKLMEDVKPFKRFTVNQELDKGAKYPTYIDLNDKGIEEPTVIGTIIVRDRP